MAFLAPVLPVSRAGMTHQTTRGCAGARPEVGLLAAFAGLVQTLCGTLVAPLMRRSPVWLVAAAASLPIGQLAAQTRSSGPVRLAITEQAVRRAYAANESGGRVTVVYQGVDTSAVERIRLHLLESAAAIRRGDFGLVTVFRSDAPALQVLTDRRGQLRCTFRAVPHGGELVLLSDDDAAVAAIHQLLQGPPPPGQD